MTLLRGAFVPCAGFGTRMQPLTDHLPKPLVAVAGTPMLDRALGIVQAAGVQRIAVNAHYRADLIVAHLADTDVMVSVEAPAILDTGGGLKAALPLLGGADPVLTLNPDVLYTGPNPAGLLAAAWEAVARDIDALLLVVPLHRAAGRGSGDFAIDGRGRVTRGGPLVYCGAQLLRPRIIADWPDRVFGLNAVWDWLIARNRLGATVYPGHWNDIGTVDALHAAERMLTGKVP